MRTLLFLFIASFFSTTSFASISCESTDGTMRVFLESREGYVNSIKILRPIELRQINESLPAGIYKNHQDVNGEINWYFEDNAYLRVTPLNEPKMAKIQLVGLSSHGPRLIALSKTLLCDTSL